MTLVTEGRVALFGEVMNGEMVLNRYGEIVEFAWYDLPRHYPGVELGAFVVMPNHVHGIIILNDTCRGGSVQPRVSAQEENHPGNGLPTGVEKTRPSGIERDYKTCGDGSVQVAGSVVEKETSRNGSSPEISKTRPYNTNVGLSEIVRAFKSYSARRINLLRKMPGVPIWQRNYYDHIIRNQQDLELTWQYIQANPGRWEVDEENP